ncbi:HAMP domain-containing histidine kinase [Brachybacterium sp. EF45031]|nr:HAMP domain-containing histidine kinase [Brachybacterium sillae]
MLTTLAVLTVGVYLSSVIADGLHTQRRDRVLAESVQVRAELATTLQGLTSATDSQRQDALASFAQAVSSSDSTSRRDVAIVPVTGEGSLSVVTTDRRLTDLLTDDVTEAVATAGRDLSWRSVALGGDEDRPVPGILVGTRVTVPGGDSYDLYLVYSLEQEQATLSFVQNVMVGGGLVLLSLVVGIAVMAAHVVTSPLQKAALAAERIAAGDLASRVDASGADELARVGTSFNAMARNLQSRMSELEELSRMQQRFVADVSHELRTPLTTIRMGTGLLHARRTDLPPDLERTTELLDAQVVRFDALLADLLEISRYDAGAVRLEAREEDLDEVVTRALEDVQVLARSRGTALVPRLHVRGPVVIDARRIDRILRNLLTNAIEHGEGRPVLVETAGDDRSVAVVVQDHGRGLSPDDARHVFDRFWRADPSRARTVGGTGLGLAISAEDAHLHGGWLQAWGQVGQGAVFRLTLPREPGGVLARSPLPLRRGSDGAPLPGHDDEGEDRRGSLPRADALPDVGVEEERP